MPDGFVHSVKVPRLYKTAAKIVRGVREEGGSFKTLIYERKHPNVSGIYALTYTSLQKGDLLDHLIRSTGILIKEPRLDPWLTRVLITELIWGKQRIISDSKPVKTILAYENELRAAFNKIPSNAKSIKNENSGKRPRYIRINTLLVSVIDAISRFEEEGWSLLPEAIDYPSYLKSLINLSGSYFAQDFHIPELLAFPAGTNFSNHAGYYKGQIILQDKASCLPAYLLNPEPGSVVLDMCAAPGMKTSHLAAILQNHGKIFAAEIDTKRYQTLLEQLQLTNSSCASALNVDAMTLDEKQCPDVEYILVDPSCSGSGMVNRPKIDNTDGAYDMNRLKRLQSFQVLLLRHALLNFRSAKRVVYSTCSINSKENEEVIDEILGDVKDAYKLVPIKDLLQGNWTNYSSKEFACEDKCLYAKVEEDLCNGFFVAVFERNFDAPLPSCKRKANSQDFQLPNNLHLSENDEIDKQIVSEALTESGNGNYKKRKRRGKRKRQSEIFNETSDMKEVTGKNGENEGDIEQSTNCFLSSNPGYQENVDESADVTPPQKKKKKKEKAAIEEQIQDTDIQNINENINEFITESVPPIKKKKKKKEKAAIEEQIQDTDIQNINENINEFITESVPPIKKKKKKKEKAVIEEQIKDTDIQRNDKNTNEFITESVSPIKKKKKKKEKMLTEEQIQDAGNDHIWEASKKKRKSHKKRSKAEISDIN